MVNNESFIFWKKVYKRFKNDNSQAGIDARKQALQRMREAKKGLPKAPIKY